MSALADTTLPVSRAQAVRLFTESRVIAAELVDELAAWTFAGGVVLILDNTTEPPRFAVCLDELPAAARATEATHA